MAWIVLVVASMFEVVMALGLKRSAGFTHPGWSGVAVLGAAASMWLLALALRTIPMGTGYAVWTGLGGAFTALVGMVALGESRDPLRLAGLATVVAGVVLLQLSEHH
jgi:quaternary ammonium compound-resistance protein SugE